MYGGLKNWINKPVHPTAEQVKANRVGLKAQADKAKRALEQTYRDTDKARIEGPFNEHKSDFAP